MQRVLMIGCFAASQLASPAADAQAMEEQVAPAFQAALDLEMVARDVESTGSDATAAAWEAASDAFAAHARTAPTGPAYWRGARAIWLVGDQLPVEDKEGRLRAFGRAKELAEAGIAANERCAECMLWKSIALAQLGATKGVWSSARSASEMADLLDRAIALAPTHIDDENNSTLGNLHYSSAILYRAVPDWFLMRFLIGMRGDKDRALRHIKVALGLHPNRLDYQVELGALLLCIGSTEDKPVRLDEGRAVLEKALTVDALAVDVLREQEAARIMIAAPEKSCGYAGDTWLEIDKEEAARGMPAKS